MKVYMSIYSKKRKNKSTAWFYDFTINGKRYRGVGGTTKTQALKKWLNDIHTWQ